MGETKWKALNRDAGLREVSLVYVCTVMDDYSVAFHSSNSIVLRVALTTVSLLMTSWEEVHELQCVLSF
jgi:hypothetical protein